MIRLDKESENLRIVEVLSSKIDASNSGDFKNEVSSVLPQGEETIIVDLTHVEFIDSSGLGVLISLLKSIPTDSQLILCGLSHSVQRLFSITKMNTAFTISESKAEAITRVK